MADSEQARPLVEVMELVKTFELRRGLSRKRLKVEAVRGVSFAITSGEAVGIVGESGSGKTTIARIVAGLERPTAGHVSLAGRELTRSPSRAERVDRARKLQLVFQDPYTSLDPHQEVRAALDEAQRIHFERSRSQLQARTLELLEAVGLGTRESRSRPRSLSGGQRQRVAIARALAAEPELVILDEAVSALDVSIQAQILNLLADLRQDFGLTYLLISHDLAVVRHLCDRVLVMHRGQLLEQGSVEAVLGDPQHEYTRRLMASVPGPGLMAGHQTNSSPTSGAPSRSSPL